MSNKIPFWVEMIINLDKPLYVREDEKRSKKDLDFDSDVVEWYEETYYNKE